VNAAGGPHDAKEELAMMEWLGNTSAATLLTWLFWCTGSILILFGLTASHLPRNRWGGIRFSYTLADDEVWRRVHKAFGLPFVLIGLWCFYPIRTLDDLWLFTWVLVPALIIAPVAAWVYSRRVYRDKFGTTRVRTVGLFKYAPPSDEEDG